MMAKLIKAHFICVNLSIEFDHKTWTIYGKNVSMFMSYVAFLGHSKIGILIYDCVHISDDLKKSIWTKLQILILFYMIW